MAEWQDISTAPKGELVIVCDAFGTTAAAYNEPPPIAEWWDDVGGKGEPDEAGYKRFLGEEQWGWLSVCPLTGDTEFLEPTHWQPLPEPHKAEPNIATA